MSEPSSGQIISSHLLKLVLGVALLAALATPACSGSDGGAVSTPTAPPGMFSTLPTSESPVLGDQPPTVELNTPEPTLTPQPTPTPNPTYTPVPTPTALPTGTPTPNPTGTPVPTPTPNPTGAPVPTATPRPTSTPAPAATPRHTAAPTYTCSEGSDPTPLHRAVDRNNIEVVRILTSLCPGDLNVISKEYFTDDHASRDPAWQSRPAAARLHRYSSDAGADPNVKVFRVGTHLTYAVGLGQM